MRDVEQRHYLRRLRDALRVPHLWLVLATWLVGRVAAGVTFGGSPAALLRQVAFTTVPAFIVGVAVVSAFRDPYTEWDANGRRWRTVAGFAVATVVLTTLGAVLVQPPS